MADADKTKELFRATRLSGFTNSIQHHPAEKQQKLIEKFKKQDATRERNVSKFVETIRNAK